MALRVFNTLSRQKEDFTPISQNMVGMYCCGPTVYNFAHVGNLRTYIFEDFLRRILEYNEFEVKHVMNITDVGHLTDDADDGEDKMEKGAKREGKTVYEVAQAYTDAFFNDTKSLNIIKPNVVCKATEHIQEMIGMIKKLEANGFTYIAEGNVYFDISKFKYYIDLGKLSLDAMKSTDRVAEDAGKKHPCDFVLWFTNSKFKNQTMKWDSPWGVGYPGWHIECSAMSTKYLGSQFDIHCGGIDHVQVHHTNEIAQTEAATGKHPWVKYWIHGEFLVINNGKMAKSDGNFITMKTLTDKGYNPLVYRYFCMGTHYRQKLNFSYEALDSAKNGYDGILKKVAILKKEILANNPDKDLSKIENLLVEKSDKMLDFEQKFLDAINDDLNIPRAVGIMHEVFKSDLDSAEKLVLILNFDTIFGLNLKDAQEFYAPKIELGDDLAYLNDLLEKRNIAKKSKDFVTADAIRAEILSKGYFIQDTPSGSFLEKR